MIIKMDLKTNFPSKKRNVTLKNKLATNFPMKICLLRVCQNKS